MSIYITGDTHGTEDWEKLNTRNFPEQKLMDPSRDYLIVVGDFGGIWDGANQDEYIIKTYNKRNFTTLFIDGNHENHDLLDEYPVEEWHGGKVHKISDRVIHLVRGQVFDIDGITFFTMGGAESTDKQYRKEGESWWAREMPSAEEYEEAVKNLEAHGNKVDIVLTHCAPEKTVADLKMPGFYVRAQNELTDFLDKIAATVNYEHWVFGHYHMDEDVGKFHLRCEWVDEIS